MMAKAEEKNQNGVYFGSFCFEEVRFDAMRGLADRRYCQELALPRLWQSLKDGSPVVGLREQGSSVGRGQVYFLQLKSGDSFVIRFYRRGGFFRRILREMFFCNPFTSAYNLRPLLELQALALLVDANVSVPEPVAALISYSGMGFSYQGMIITKEVTGAVNLLNLVDEFKSGTILESEIVKIAKASGFETSKMLGAGIFHADLHLGNILVERSTDRVTIIDFDKAKRIVTKKQKKEYYGRLVDRWSRSCEKHKVEFAIEPFIAGLNLSQQES